VNVSAAAGFFIYVRFMKYIKVRSASPCQPERRVATSRTRTP
jgi:hypothetical protein